MTNDAYRNPQIWGPPTWVFLFTVGLTADYNAYKQFFEILAAVLPCERCQANYKKYLAANPIKRNIDIMEWLTGLYNQSAKIKRSKDEVVRYYQKMYGVPQPRTAPPTRREMKAEMYQQQRAATAVAAGPRRHALFTRRALRSGGCCGRSRHVTN